MTPDTDSQPGEVSPADGPGPRELLRYRSAQGRWVVAAMILGGYTDMAWAKNEGLDNGVQRTPENSTPTSFRQWCEEVLKPTVAS